MFSGDFSSCQLKPLEEQTLNENQTFDLGCGDLLIDIYEIEEGEYEVKFYDLERIGFHVIVSKQKEFHSSQFRYVQFVTADDFWPSIYPLRIKCKQLQGPGFILLRYETLKYD